MTKILIVALSSLIAGGVVFCFGVGFLTLLGVELGKASAYTALIIVSTLLYRIYKDLQ